jgi:hypothetical protein
MNITRSLFFILICVVSEPSFGLSVVCNEVKVVDEVVSNQYFQLRKTEKGSYGSHFEIELAFELDDSSLKDIHLFKMNGDELEYFFNLKFFVSGETQANVSAGFTISNEMIEGAELLAVFENKTELCTTLIRKYRTKL